MLLPLQLPPYAYRGSTDGSYTDASTYAVGSGSDPSSSSLNDRWIN
nr:hypothetical protein Q903MT_gene4391 [Picea sitchensis]